jgi:hypothetical protein
VNLIKNISFDRENIDFAKKLKSVGNFIEKSLFFKNESPKSSGN